MTLTDSDLNLVRRDPRTLCGGSGALAPDLTSLLGTVDIPFYMLGSFNFRFENSIFKSNCF